MKPGLVGVGDLSEDGSERVVCGCRAVGYRLRPAGTDTNRKLLEVTMTQADTTGGPEDHDELGGPDRGDAQDEFGGPEPADAPDEFGGPEPADAQDEFGGPGPT